MLKLAIGNLLSRPIRSLLALLGLTVAIVGMVCLFAVAEGIDQIVYDTFGRIPGLVVLQTGAPVALFSRIPADWEQEISQIDGVEAVNAEIWARANLIEGKRIIAPPRLLFGTDMASRARLKWDVYRQNIEEGRFLNAEDCGVFNVVISRQIADEFDKKVGDTLRVADRDLTIVGIYHCGSLLLDFSIVLDMVPARILMRHDPKTVCCFYVEPSDGADKGQLADRIRSVFRGRRPETTSAWDFVNSAASTDVDLLTTFFKTLDRTLKSPSGGNQDAAEAPTPLDEAATVSDDLPVEVRSADDWTEQLAEFTAELDVSLMILTGIGVTIAVLNILNTMLMSVSERMIEFGVLKANGWSKTDVLKLITFESAVLGFCGGVFGCLFGWMAAQVINWKWPEHTHLVASPGLLLFAFCFSLVLGALGGLYPAMRAMRMMPMDAIRRG